LSFRRKSPRPGLVKRVMKWFLLVLLGGLLLFLAYQLWLQFFVG
jgi:hypothetical protein